MIRRFVPPALAVLTQSPDAGAARAIEAARQEGFAEGQQAGFREGFAEGQQDGHDAAAAACREQLAELERKFAKQQAVGAITAALYQVLAARECDVRDLENATRSVIVELLGLIFPILLQQAAGQEIASLLTTALTERAPEQLTLRAHPETLRLAGMNEHAERLALQEMPDMALGTAEFHWAGGGLTFDPAALLARTAAILLPIDKEPIE